jgi:hypothetical protein
MKRSSPDNEPIFCPHCGTNLLGDPVPQEYIDKGHYAPGTHYKLEIGIVYPEKYDGVWHYMCPECEGTWGGREAVLKELKA